MIKKEELMPRNAFDMQPNLHPRGIRRHSSLHNILPLFKQLRNALVGALVLSLSACNDDNDRASAGSSSENNITIEEILQIRQVGAPSWSSNGSEVAFTWSHGAETNLWATTVEAEEPGKVGASTLRQISPLTGRSTPMISPDWKFIAYVSKKHIWVLAIDGGLPEQLTQAEHKYSGLNWSPNSQNLAFIIEGEKNTDIGWLQIADHQLTMVGTTEQDEDSPIWSPASDKLAFIKRFPNWQGYEIWTSEREGSQLKKIVTETYDRGVEEFRFNGNHHWSPDGTRIVYLSSRSGYNHVWTVPVSSGEPLELTHGPYVDYSPRWSPRGDQILFVSSRAGDLEDRHIWLIDVLDQEPERISPNGFCTNASWSRDGSRVAYLRSSTTEPPEIVVQDARPGAPVHQLTESLPDPTLTASFVEPEAVRYKSSDGTEVPSILLRSSASQNSGLSPGLMYFHGKGGINLKGWGGLRFYAFHQYLVQQGYSVLFVNWRGTHIGYGTDFERANYRDYAGGELDDVIASANFLTQEVGVDPERIACWGGSYGGYMTMLTITKAPDVCNAGISRVGVSDWMTFLEQSQRRLWNVRLRAKLGNPDENLELYERSAAIRYVHQARSPLLITQGQDDDGVVPEQGESLYKAMKEAGKTVEYLTYIGEGHGYRHIGSLRDLYYRVDNFLTKYNSGDQHTSY